MGQRFAVHHFTVSVRDVDDSTAFYGIFGFRLALRWDAPDNSLVIAHLADESGFILEMFSYHENGGLPRPELDIGNNLHELGVKHIALRVADVRAARAELLSIGHVELTEIQRGRTGVEYFFVSDPDGNWVEIVQDDRSLLVVGHL
ncbi:MAG TPA: VOC family protein [Mycobacteriales bacterium]|nr:VOC family protein [Mycobacteriales bacterium]